jgi:hypothetical protein
VRALQLTLEPWTLAVCRLDAGATVPSWAQAGDFHAVVRTPEELSVVCFAAEVPPGVRAERDWRCFTLAGPIAFDETGVLAAVATPLAAARVGIFAVSTFDTDYVLVPGRMVEAAVRALEDVGHRVARRSTA